MEEFNVKKYLKRYRLTLAIIFIVFLFILSSFINSTGGLIAFVVTVVIYKCILVFWRKYKITNILLYDMDVEKYKTVIDAGKFYSKQWYEQIDIALFSGEYQLVVNMSAHKLNSKISMQQKFIYLTALGRVYFILQDIEKLAKVCDYFEQIIALEKGGFERYNKIFPIFNFYRHYINNEFFECKQYIEDNIAKSNLSPLQKTMLHYNLAVLLYKWGDIKNAVKEFNYVCISAPQLNLSKLSEKYLIKIADGLPFANEYISISPTNDGIAEINSKMGGVQNRRILKRLAVGTIIVFLIILFSIAVPIYSIATGESYILGNGFERTMADDDVYNAASKKYDDFEFEKAIMLYDENDEYCGVIGVCYSESYGVVAGTLAENIQKERFFYDVVESIKVGDTFYLTNPDGKTFLVEMSKAFKNTIECDQRETILMGENAYSFAIDY